VKFSERTLIEEILAPLANPADGSLGLTDDAAFIACAPGRDLVVTQDTLIGSVHFRDQDPAAEIARKSLRVNLSDLAAKGAEPVAYLLSLALPDGVERAWAEDFAAGLRSDQDEFGIALYGGDTVRSPGHVMVTVTACGTVPRGKMVRRAGARAGELIYVSGTIGDGAFGLAALNGGTPAIDALDARARDELAGRFLIPRPRLELAPALRAHASAAMDISDGLAGDLALLAAASRVTVEVDLCRVPLSPPAAAAIAAEPDLLIRAVTGGDDYEIVCTVPEARASAFEAAAGAAGIAVSRIGVVTGGEGPPVFRDSAGRPVRFEQASFSHF
jgi:thiamine-monophosphate kinase